MAFQLALPAAARASSSDVTERSGTLLSNLDSDAYAIPDRVICPPPQRNLLAALPMPQRPGEWVLMAVRISQAVLCNLLIGRALSANSTHPGVLASSKPRGYL